MLSSPSSELMRAPALGSLDYQFYSGAGFHSLPLCPVDGKQTVHPPPPHPSYR